MTSLSRQKDNQSACLSLCISYALLTTPVNVSPFLTVAIMSGLSLTADRVGLVLTVELVCLALTAAILSPLASRFSLKRILLVGAGIVLLGNTLTLQAGSEGLLIIYRALAGIGAGVLLFGVNIGIARTVDPVKVYGLANATGLIIATVLFLVMPALVERYGIQGGFGSLTLLTLIVLVLIFLLSVPKQIVEKSKGGLTMSVSTAKILCMLVGLFLTTATFIAFYAFSEPIGTNANLSSQQMGVLLATVQFVGIFVAGLASWLGSRWGVFNPLVGALSVTAFSIFIATQTDSSFIFVASFMVFNLLFIFSMPFLLAIGATLDMTGRLASIGAGTLYFGAAGGPYLGGYLITNQGIPSIGIITCVGVIIALTCFWYVTKEKRALNQ
jgi:MFS transporter, DHA1 family, inner membrane transport protein